MNKIKSADDIKKTWELLESIDKNKNIYIEENKKEVKKSFKEILSETQNKK